MSYPESIIHELQTTIVERDKRISLLEKVAEWSVSFNDIAKQATNPNFKHWEAYVRIQSRLESAQKAAGYLEQDNECH